MWVGAHITNRDKKVIRANISSTDNQRIKNTFVIIVNMRKKLRDVQQRAKGTRVCK